MCWADRVSHSEHLLSAVITAHCGWKPTDSHQPVHWQDTHTHISPYTALCVPAANTLLHALPRKLCHFIFVPVTISHVFSGHGWIIPRRASACGLTGAEVCQAKIVTTPHNKKHVSWGEEHSAFWVFSWFCDETSADISRSFSSRGLNDSRHEQLNQSNGRKGDFNVREENKHNFQYLFMIYIFFLKFKI